MEIPNFLMKQVTKKVVLPSNKCSWRLLQIPSDESWNNLWDGIMAIPHLKQKKREAPITAWNYRKGNNCPRRCSTGKLIQEVISWMLSGSFSPQQHLNAVVMPTSYFIPPPRGPKVKCARLRVRVFFRV